jgi:3-phenylpropionate/cinnamic acid dioxygenase small subunit
MARHDGAMIQSDLFPLVSFLWLEADLLDGGEYDDWLALWTADGKYVVPIDPKATDFENTLNYAYDDHELRSKRVARLRSGQSVSASPIARTIRSQSRFRLLSSGKNWFEIRCAQFLVESRRERERYYAADVTHRLVSTEGGFRIDQKVIRLINSTDTLDGIGYIF